MSEDDANQGSGRDTKFSIDSAQGNSASTFCLYCSAIAFSACHPTILTDPRVTVFNKLVVTALKFTPVVVGHHLPFKTLLTGRMCVHCVGP